LLGHSYQKMSIRTATGIRMVQKKLVRLLDDLKKSPKLQEALNVATHDSDIDIFLNEKKVEDFEDDVIAFKDAVEQAFKFISRIRGKKQDIVELSQSFTNKLQEMFPETFDTTTAPTALPKKRGRVDDNDERTEKRSRAPSPTITDELTAKNKASIREIVGRMTKNNACEPFLYEVDKSLYPEYYDVISEPMDFYTFKNKLNYYSSLTEALSNMRLIWKNCLEYNLEGSDIFAAAIMLAKECETIIGEKFGNSRSDFEWIETARKQRKKRGSDATEILSKQREKTPKAKSEKNKNKNKDILSSDSDIFISHAVMKEILRILYDDKKSIPFQSPVDINEFPDYNEIVSCPMDLCTVRSKLQKSQYDDNCLNFIEDMRLIWRNCLEYNEQDSEIACQAEELSARFERLVSDSSTRRKDKERKEDQKPEFVELNSKKLEEFTNSKTEESNLMLELLKSLTGYQYITPFLHPVNPKDALGYYEIVKKPMDISSIDKKIEKW